MNGQLEYLIDQISERHQCIDIERRGFSPDKDRTIDRLDREAEQLENELEALCSELGMDAQSILDSI